MEIRLLSFSTGRPHPLAEQPIIFITKTSLHFGHCSVVIEIVGDFIALLISFSSARDEHEDMFFLVRWKRGEAHCVSDNTAHSGVVFVIYLVSLASVLRMGNLLKLQFSFGRHPRHPELDTEYTGNSQDHNQERRHPAPRSSMRAQPPSTHSTCLDRPSRLPRRTKPYLPRSPSYHCPIQSTIPLQSGGRYPPVQRRN